MNAINKEKYYPQHLHIHSIYEPGASMEGHMYFAALQGMRYIWFTEHDVFWTKKPFSLGFEADELMPDETMTPTKIFLPTEDSKGEVALDASLVYEGNSSLRLTAKENKSEEWCGAAAMIEGKYICQSLCRMPLLSFSHYGTTAPGEDVRYIFDLCLSERPPDQRFAHILFVSGSAEGLEAPHTLIVPLSVSNEWRRESLDISRLALEDAAKDANIGGLDNVISYLTARVETRRGASASLYMDSLKAEGRADAYETKKRQTDVANEIGKKYGVTPFVTAEISAGGFHKNCFTTDTPVFIYHDPSRATSHEAACELMSRRGLVFSLNHPFVHLKGKEDVDYDAECDALIEKFAADKGYGAAMLEVGFPFGRYAPYSAHTRLWDGLALRGVLLTGHGATDSHMMTEGWFSGNNFASFIGVVSDTEPCERDFTDSMRAGRLYAANPLVIKGEFSFYADGFREMGSINLLPRGKKSCVKLSLEITNHNWKVAWIHNGERVRCDKATRMGYSGELEILTNGGIDFVRAEVYDYFGNLLLMTNPIYYTDSIDNIKNGTVGRAINK